MRSIMVMLVMLAALLAGGWIGGETLLARSATRMIAADPRLTSAGVLELREADRIGVRIDTLRFNDPDRGIAGTTDWAYVWVKPNAPNALHVQLAGGSEGTVGPRRLTLGPEGAAASLRFSPTRGMAASDAEMTAKDVALDGAALLRGITLRAELAGFGADSPQGTRAAYEVNGSLTDLDLARLRPDVTGLLGISGAGRLWLSAVPLKAGDVAGGDLPPAPPRLIGLRADGIDVTLDAMKARVYGRLLADPQGVAAGRILIDTADPDGFVDWAVGAGLMPPAGRTVAVMALRAAAAQAAEAAPPTGLTADPLLSPTAAADAADATEAVAEVEAGERPNGSSVPRRSVTDLAPHISPVAEIWPAPREGEIRIPLIFSNGTMSLGTLPLGPAPRLSAPAQAG